ncbi:MAG: HEAT repeat domain-containing protein, partial [Anaerolineae bacterium]|nr:HEAT repeat domain-containing protein [Anaerolineae bacterium]
LNIQGLIEALEAENAGIRKRAAAALRTLGATQALPALRDAYEKETDPEAQMTLASALEALKQKTGILVAPPEVADDEPSVTKCIAQLQSDNVETVIQAARELGDLGDKIAVEPLVLLFNDHKQSIHVRFAVAEALLKLESAPIEVALLANLRHSDWHIRRNGAAILGQLKAEWAIQPLARALKDENHVVRRTARAALKHIGTPESRKALAQADNITQRPPMRPDGQQGTENARPVAPRTGMLQRLQPAPGEQPAETDTPSQSSKLSTRHLNPTRPLDPEVLKQLEEMYSDHSETLDNSKNEEEE